MTTRGTLERSNQTGGNKILTLPLTAPVVHAVLVNRRLTYNDLTTLPAGLFDLPSLELL